MNSKIVKGLAMILTRSKVERVLIITQSSVAIENFNTYLALCSFAA